MPNLRSRPLFALTLLVFLFQGCTQERESKPSREAPVKDIHSFAQPADVRVTHAAFDWSVDFERQTLAGSVTWTVERAGSGPLVLDTKHLEISGAKDADSGEALTWKMGTKDEILGLPLNVTLSSTTRRVEIAYKTTDKSAGLQWLAPTQTADKKFPFMYSQAQSILARTFFPAQDSPGVRFTYSARVRTPEHLRAVMSAESLEGSGSGDFRFEMKNPIPSYLVAIAVGDIAFQALSARTGVWAERSVLERAAFEFADTEKMVVQAERLYGPYRWGRYDIIVLPPSFPFGGMENPRLTFATPTILAGDRSLVALVAHELAHSWSGNLVTNATWSDFWLNEGFTVYFERRIQEAVYGRDRSEMEAVIGFQDLQEDLASLPAGDTILHVELKGRDPDDAFSNVPYEKGYLFLRLLEETFGRTRFDAFLSKWFDTNAFQSRTTADFEAYLARELFPTKPDAAATIDLSVWLHQPGLPKDAPRAQSPAFARAEELARDFLQGKVSAESLPGKTWTTFEWLHFLRKLEAPTSVEALARLDAAWKLTSWGNSEVLNEWLLLSVKSGYAAAEAALEDFLVRQGRRKYLKPLYQALAATPEGKTKALAIYKKARAGYHAISSNTIDQILGL